MRVTVPSLLLAFLVPSLARAACDCGGSCTGTSVTASSGGHTITYTFSETETCGQFANGDYWVVAPVTIQSVSPTPSGGRHGWMVNPTGSAQPYDDRIHDYDSGLQPATPYAASAGDSIIKTVSKSGSCGPSPDFNCLEFATVLTVVGSVPTDNGSTVFRPPYFGTNKPQHSTGGLRTDLLPTHAPAGSSVPTLAQIEARYRWVQLDHGPNSYRNRQMIPSENFDSTGWIGTSTSEYGAEIARDSAEAALRLMLDDSEASKQQAVINYTQAGIDYYYMFDAGVKWTAEAGLKLGRKLAPVFAAVLLDDATMKAAIQNASGRNTGTKPPAFNTWQEDGQIFYSSIANGGSGQVLWGSFGGFWSESAYRTYCDSGSGARDHGDPWKYIDGGKPGDSASYQKCCSSKPYKSTALALILMSELRTTWDNDDFITYVDRWVTHGAWYAPDPQEGDPACRDTSLDGIWTDSGSYGSNFAEGMWDTYRAGAGGAQLDCTATEGAEPHATTITCTPTGFTPVGSYTWECDGDNDFNDICDTNPQSNKCVCPALNQGTYTVGGRVDGHTGTDVINITGTPSISKFVMYRMEPGDDQPLALYDPMPASGQVVDLRQFQDDCFGWDAVSSPSVLCVEFVHTCGGAGCPGSLTEATAPRAYYLAPSQEICMPVDEVAVGDHTLTATPYDGAPSGGVCSGSSGPDHVVSFVMANVGSRHEGVSGSGSYSLRWPTMQEGGQRPASVPFAAWLRRMVGGTAPSRSFGPESSPVPSPSPDAGSGSP